MVRILLVAEVVLGCASSESRPLPEAILGEWEVLCWTDAEASATCLGKDDSGLYKKFFPDGKVVAGALRGGEMTGTWTLSGDVLVLVFEGGGLRLEERYLARTHEDKLVLWNPAGESGTVLGRVGAPFRPAASKTSAGGPTSHAIAGLRYTIDLPKGHRLARDDNARQRWAPGSGEGFVVELSVSPRAREEVQGVWVTPPCDERDRGGVLVSGGTIDGVERDTSIGMSFCLAERDDSLMCSTEHTRGYLEPSEKDAALAFCRSLSLR